MGRFLGVGAFFSVVVLAANTAYSEHNELSPEYNVIVLRMGTVGSGTLSFARTSNSPGPTTGSPLDNENGANPGDGTTGAGNDTDVGTNPVASGDFGPVGNSTGMPGNTAGNTSGSVNDQNSTAGSTTGTGTTTGPAAASPQPASYWTRARANGEVAATSNDPSSADYWTTARARGEGNTGGSGGNFGNGSSDSIFSSGQFAADLDEENFAGTYHAAALGNFSLWYATTDSTGGTTTFAGWGNADTIMGGISSADGGIWDALWSGNYFFGTASDENDAMR